MSEDFKSFYKGVLNERFAGLLPPPLQDAYEPLSCLSKADASEAYLVRRRLDGAKAVLRVVKAGAGESVMMERQILSHLDHPAIPKALDALSDGEREYLVREYAEGQTLSAYVKAHGALSEAELVDIAVELCGILDYIHRQNPAIIHRDIKPENIVIAEDGRVKLIDFGIARAYRDQAGSDTVAIGTRPYMAPEQFGGAQTDARADLFSLGVVMIYMATLGPDRTGLRHRFPYKNLLPVVRKCVMVDPAARPQSARQLKKSLLMAVRRTRRRVLLAAGAAALVALLLFLALRLGERIGFERGHSAGHDEGVAIGQVEGELMGFDKGYQQRLDELIVARSRGYDDNAARYAFANPDQGNTGGNLCNKGLAVEADGAIYYATGDQVLRMTSSGARRVFCNHEGWSLNVYKEHLYHIGKGGYVYRAKLDGSACEPIVKQRTDMLLIEADKLYLRIDDGGFRLCSADLDGGNLRALSALNNMHHLNVCQGYFYFALGPSGPERNLYRLRIGAPDSEIELLDKAEVNWVNALGDYVFYNAMDGEGSTGIGNRIMRTSVDGTERVALFEGVLSYLNVTPYGIFGSNGFDRSKLYKFALDGGRSELLADARVRDVNVAGDWVFYRDADDLAAMYRVRVDGTQNQRIE